MGFDAHFKGRWMYIVPNFPSLRETMFTNFCCYSCWWYRLHCVIICSLGGIEHNSLLEIWYRNMFDYCIHTSNRPWCGSKGIRCYLPFSNNTFVPLSCDFIIPRCILKLKRIKKNQRNTHP